MPQGVTWSLLAAAVILLLLAVRTLTKGADGQRPFGYALGALAAAAGGYLLSEAAGGLVPAYRLAGGAALLLPLLPAMRKPSAPSVLLAVAGIAAAVGLAGPVLPTLWQPENATSGTGAESDPDAPEGAEEHPQGASTVRLSDVEYEKALASRLRELRTVLRLGESAVGEYGRRANVQRSTVRDLGLSEVDFGTSEQAIRALKKLRAVLERKSIAQENLLRVNKALQAWELHEGEFRFLEQRRPNLPPYDDKLKSALAGIRAQAKAPDFDGILLAAFAAIESAPAQDPSASDVERFAERDDLWKLMEQ